MKFVNIITPCSRPENLLKISKSINIPRENYRWIVVCDSPNIPEKELIPDNCEIYFHQNPRSCSGNAQRNFALSLVDKHIEGGYIYYNDDDTLMHPDLWETVKDLDNDLISFSQNNPDGTLRLKGDRMVACHVDSHNFITSCELAKGIEWILDNYGADAGFAQDVFAVSKSYVFIPKVLSVYNCLR